ncbi:MAG TPA: helix-turn-helix transcriptional regulator [Stellaceae bacterium]
MPAGSVGVQSGGALRLRCRDGSHLSLLVCPLPGRNVGIGKRAPIALALLSDPAAARRTVPESRLTEILALTPAEARLVSALLDGARLQDYTERTGVSINTVKTQLKSVFEKTGQMRQSDLIRALLGNPILRLASSAPEAMRTTAP